MAASEKATPTGGRAYRAVHRFAPMSSRKARYAVDLVRGLPVNQALERLRYCPRRAASTVQKVLQSAIANAGQDVDVDANRLFVSDARADDGPIMPRGKARSRGQWFELKVRLCHVSVEVREMPEDGLPGRRTRAAGSGGARGGKKGGGRRPKGEDAKTAAGAAEQTDVASGQES